jgi:hypothetical protein
MRLPLMPSLLRSNRAPLATATAGVAALIVTRGIACLTSESGNAPTIVYVFIFRSPSGLARSPREVRRDGSFRLGTLGNRAQHRFRTDTQSLESRSWHRGIPLGSVFYVHSALAFSYFHPACPHEPFTPTPLPPALAFAFSRAAILDGVKMLGLRVATLTLRDSSVLSRFHLRSPFYIYIDGEPIGSGSSFQCNRA